MSELDQLVTGGCRQEAEIPLFRLCFGLGRRRDEPQRGESVERLLDPVRETFEEVKLGCDLLPQRRRRVPVDVLAQPCRLLLGPSAQRALLLELCPQPLERRGALGEQPLELGPFVDARRRLRLRRIAALPVELVRLFGRGNPPDQVLELLLSGG